MHLHTLTNTVILGVLGWMPPRNVAEHSLDHDGKQQQCVSAPWRGIEIVGLQLRSVICLGSTEEVLLLSIWKPLSTLIYGFMCCALLSIRNMTYELNKTFSKSGHQTPWGVKLQKGLWQRVEALEPIRETSVAMPWSNLP